LKSQIIQQGKEIEYLQRERYGEKYPKTGTVQTTIERSMAFRIKLCLAIHEFLYIQDDSDQPGTNSLNRNRAYYSLN
jgi:hypothetical protein